MESINNYIPQGLSRIGDTQPQENELPQTQEATTIQTQQLRPIQETRRISTSIPDAPLTTLQERTEAAVSSTLSITPRPNNIFQTAKLDDPTHFRDHLESWFSSSIPTFSDVTVPKGSVFQRRKEPLAIRERNQAINSTRRNLNLAMGFADIARKMLDGNVDAIRLPSERVKQHEISKLEFARSQTADKNYKSLIRGVYDQSGNLQAVAVVMIKQASSGGKHLYIDKVANAPWNILRGLKKELIEKLMDARLLSDEEPEKREMIEKLEQSLNEIPSDDRTETGKGAATELMRQLALEAQQCGCTSIELLDVSQSDLYDRCGFSQTGMSGTRALYVSNDVDSPFQNFLNGRRSTIPHQ